MMRNNRVMLCTLWIVAMLLSGCSNQAGAQLNDVNVMMFKTPACGCCGNYGRYLEADGVNVEVIDTRDMESIKTKYHVPLQVQSCHTMTIGKYFVEGHVPVEAIEKLLAEKPDIAGIAMQGMPVGSPGMPGDQVLPFIIFAVHKDGSIREFMRF